jgi:hypothetical protein
MNMGALDVRFHRGEIEELIVSRYPDGDFAFEAVMVTGESRRIVGPGEGLRFPSLAAVAEYCDRCGLGSFLVVL